MKSDTNMSEICVGIDLGTTNTVVALHKKIRRVSHYDVIENNTGSRGTPSVVYIQDKDVVVGKQAKDQLQIDPERAIHDSKRLIGRKKGDPGIDKLFSLAQFRLRYDYSDNPIIAVPGVESPDEMIFHPEQISALILGDIINTIKNKEGRVPDRCVITVPAYFNHIQRKATENAAKIAKIENVIIANEPTAAAIAYQKQNQIENGTVLVFDFGGGTLDVSILHVDGHNFTVKAVSGDTSLGGEDIDVLLVKEMLRRFKEKNPGRDPSTNQRCMAILKDLCEEAKISLSSAIRVSVTKGAFFEGIDLNEKLTRAELEYICQDIFDKITKPIEEALKEAKMEKEDIDQVITVGGSSNIPAVKEIVSDFFDKRIVPKTGVSFSEGIAVGASIICHNESLIEAKKKAVPFTDTTHLVKRKIIGSGMVYGEEEEEEEEIEEPYNIIDVLPASFGVRNEKDKFTKFLLRNQPVPQCKEFTFATMEDNRSYVHIEVLQGEGPTIHENSHILIGKFKLTGIPRKKKGEVTIKVRLFADKNGIIKVSATCETNGVSKELEINYNKLIGSDEFAEYRKMQDEFMENKEILMKCDELLNKMEKNINKLQRKGKDVSAWKAFHKNYSSNRPSRTDLIHEYYEHILQSLKKLEKELEKK
jgi:molecular chaperone DnaK (HSP70)